MLVIIAESGLCSHVSSVDSPRGNPMLRSPTAVALGRAFGHLVARCFAIDCLCESITTVANDRVRRRKEQKKVQGALRAALKRDLVEAGHYRRIMEEFFGAEEDSVSDPVETSAVDLSGEDCAGEDSGEAAPSDNTDSCRL